MDLSYESFVYFRLICHLILSLRHWLSYTIFIHSIIHSFYSEKVGTRWFSQNYTTKIIALDNVKFSNLELSDLPSLEFLTLLRFTAYPFGRMVFTCMGRSMNWKFIFIFFLLLLLLLFTSPLSQGYEIELPDVNSCDQVWLVLADVTMCDQCDIY